MIIRRQSRCFMLITTILLVGLFHFTDGWTQWNYFTQWADDNAGVQRVNQETYFTIWGYNTTIGSTSRQRESGTKTTCSNGNCQKSANLDGTFKPDQNAPRPRRGHSMVIHETPTENAVYKGYTYVIMFGGRDNDNASFVHIPKTYKVESVNGTIRFATYDENPVDPCNDFEHKWYSEEEISKANCNDGTQHDKITVGIIYNDVWAYKMCKRSPEPPSTPGFTQYRAPSTPSSAATPQPTGADTSQRYFDQPCEGSGWVMLHSGAPEGGCVIQLGILVCTVPSERYNHGSVVFDDGVMYVYGGFSQRCADYCDDLWFFDIFMKSWRQVYCSNPTNCGGDLSHLFSDVLTSYLAGARYSYGADPETGLPLVPMTPNHSTTAIPNPWAGPGKRWKFSWVSSTKLYKCTKPASAGTTATKVEFKANRTGTCDPAKAQCCQDTALFGGHRLWQGYDKGNSQDNDWSDYRFRQPGGYLDDLWIYTKFLDFATTPGESFHNSDGIWKFIHPKEERVFDGDINDWVNRERTRTFTLWPGNRAGHGSAFDSDRNLIWLHGGYSTYFPYLSTDGEGSGDGTIAVGIGGFIPYPGFQHFRDDLWYYNLTSGVWRQVEFAPGDVFPDGRTDHVLLLLGEVLFLHGGYGDNYYYDDTWYFNITTFKWLRKERYVYPIYPDSCTDDIEFLKSPAGASCVKNQWSLHLDREAAYPFSVVPYQADGGQQYYWPDTTHGPYFKPFPKGYARKNINLKDADKLREYTPAVGEAEFPFGALGPMEYAKPFTWRLDDTSNVTLLERCTSVFGEPTRGKLLDGNFSRANASVFIPQPRRQRPGWDGCRDRWDNRNDGSLPMILQYQHPTARSGHRAVFYKDMNEIIMYGGMGYLVEQSKSVDNSWKTKVYDDMWYFNLFHCANNCSDHGMCYYGFCQCYVGYYGEDCSNTSCPGTACYYDDYTHDQICVHACQAGYNHTDNDTYVQDIAKLPCNPEPAHYLPGESNGICDGFGTTQCAPPFLGNDCGTKDCKSNCSFNGWCSIEYPVSRCMCQAGYFGEVCEHKLCLNNCSYPNGVCNTTTGYCMCRMTYSPYNNTRPYKPWDGEDCSWLWAYAAGTTHRIGVVEVYFAIVMVLCISAVLSINFGQGNGMNKFNHHHGDHSALSLMAEDEGHFDMTENIVTEELLRTWRSADA